MLLRALKVCSGSLPKQERIIAITPMTRSRGERRNVLYLIKYHQDISSRSRQSLVHTASKIFGYLISTLAQINWNFSKAELTSHLCNEIFQQRAKPSRMNCRILTIKQDGSDTGRLCAPLNCIDGGGLSALTQTEKSTVLARLMEVDHIADELLTSKEKILLFKRRLVAKKISYEIVLADRIEYEVFVRRMKIFKMKWNNN